jgi:hypothetical protein
MFALTPKHSLPVKAQPAEPVQTTIVFHGLIAGLESLIQQNPHMATEATYQAALESQQLDHSAQQAAEEEVADTLDKYATDHPRTGPLHVYLLGNPGAASFDQDNETTPMKALVNAALRSKSKMVAALMPEDETVFQVADIPQSLTLRQLADTVLAQESIPVIVGKAAFEAFMEDPSSVFSVATEGVAVEIGLTISVLTAVTVVAQLMGKGLKALFSTIGKKASKEDGPSARPVESLESIIKRTFMNDAWIQRQSMQMGQIAASDIYNVLVSGNSFPSDLPAAVHRHIQSVTTTFQTFKAPYDAYVKRINSVVEHMVKMDNHDEAIAWGTKQLKGIQEPATFLHINPKDLLGNPTLQKEYGALNLEFQKAGDKEAVVRALSREEAKTVAGLLIDVIAALPKIDALAKADVHRHDYEDNIFSEGKGYELWQEMIGQGIDDHYSHNYHMNEWEGAVWELEDSVKRIAKALETYLRRSIR